MSKRTSKKAQYQAAAGQALKQALAERANLVGGIGEAEEARDKQQQLIVDAQARLAELDTAVADAYQRALDGGWTATELKAMGISKPNTGRAVKPPTRRAPAKKPTDEGSTAQDTGDAAHDHSPEPAHAY